MQKIHLAILIYNKNVDESLTCNSLKKMKLDNNIDITVIDNSTKDYNNSKSCEVNKYNYISMNGNKGISKAYNTFLNTLTKNSTDDFIVWLDDDTKITKKYFDVLKNTIIQEKDVEIFAPVIYGQDGIIYSPNYSRYLKNKLVKKRNNVFNIKKYNAINSCLCVKVSIYKHYRYDENLFLDQVDQNFFDDMRKLNKKFKVLDVDILQNFSQRDQKLDPKKMIVRQSIRTTDIMKYGRKSFLNTIKSSIKASLLSYKIGFKCKSIKIIIKCNLIVIKLFFKNIIGLVRRIPNE